MMWMILLWSLNLGFAVSDLVLYPNDTLTTSTAVTLSQGCITAMEASLSCDPYLQSLANQDYYGSMDNSSLQISLCDPACGNTLSSYHSSVISSCISDPQPWPGIPATWYGDTLWATYNQTCLQDSKSGLYCNDYISNITAALTGDSQLTDLPKDQLCSSCVIGLLQQSQGTSFSNYDASVASQWSTVQSTCGINSPIDVQPLTTNVTDFPGYAPSNYTTSSQCMSGVQYSVKQGDDCQKIATSQNIATGTLISINNLLPDCSDLLSGASLCLPQTCSIYVTQPGDDCYSIAASQGISYVQLISYNPTLNPSCTNLLSGVNLCVGQPGPVYNGSAIAGATVTRTSPYASTTATPPAGNIAHGTTSECGKYYQVQSGDYCQLVALNNSIAVDLFTLINPSINPGCTNLVPGLFYCVFPLLDWNATANATAAASIVPAPTATPSGTTGQCYTWHTVVAGDNCALLESSYDITFSQLQGWNPALSDSCSNLILGDAYCVKGASVNAKRELVRKSRRN